jgi:TetR/AcrR family transcriptional repressor of nem operon
MERNNTVNQLLDIGETLLQTRGYHDFSFKDMATHVGIKTSSIHYYFPTKSDLARELIIRHTEDMAKILQGLRKPSRYKDQLIEYIHAIANSTYGKGMRMCLGGMLAIDVLTLAPDVQEAIKAFFLLHETWLIQTLEKGREAKEFKFSGDCAPRARAILSYLEGLLLLSRLYKEEKRLMEFKDIVVLLSR